MPIVTETSMSKIWCHSLWHCCGSVYYLCIAEPGSGKWAVEWAYNMKILYGVHPSPVLFCFCWWLNNRSIAGLSRLSSLDQVVTAKWERSWSSHKDHSKTAKFGNLMLACDWVSTVRDSLSLFYSITQAFSFILALLFNFVIASHLEYSNHLKSFAVLFPGDGISEDWDHGAPRRESGARARVAGPPEGGQWYQVQGGFSFFTATAIISGKVSGWISWCVLCRSWHDITWCHNVIMASRDITVMWHHGNSLCQILWRNLHAVTRHHITLWRRGYCAAPQLLPQVMCRTWQETRDLVTACYETSSTMLFLTNLCLLFFFSSWN